MLYNRPDFVRRRLRLDDDVDDDDRYFAWFSSPIWIYIWIVAQFSHA